LSKIHIIGDIHGKIDRYRKLLHTIPEGERKSAMWASASVA